jgi:hypothetical protein
MRRRGVRPGRGVSEAEFLDVMWTKVFIAFLLAIHGHLY